MGLGNKQAQYFARLAQGSVGAACLWAELERADANLYKTKTWLVDSLAGYAFADALNFAEALLVEVKRITSIWVDIEKATSKTDINRKASRTVFQMIISLLHDVMKWSATPAKEAVNFDQKEQIKKLAARFDAEHAAEKIADCYRALQWIESSVNEKLIFERFLLSFTDSDTIRVSR
jgi:hypothetical protein